MGRPNCCNVGIFTNCKRMIPISAQSAECSVHRSDVSADMIVTCITVSSILYLMTAVSIKLPDRPSSAVRSGHQHQEDADEQ